MDADEITPIASWSNDRIIAWARTRKLDRFPVAKIEMRTTSKDEPNIAEVHFERPARVVRLHSLRMYGL